MKIAGRNESDFAFSQIYFKKVILATNDHYAKLLLNVLSI